MIFNLSSLRWTWAVARNVSSHINQNLTDSILLVSAVISWHVSHTVKIPKRVLKSPNRLRNLACSFSLQNQSIHLSQSRILAFHVSRDTLHSRFTQQFYSGSRFTERQNKGLRGHENTPCSLIAAFTYLKAPFTSSLISPPPSENCVFLICPPPFSGIRFWIIPSEFLLSHQLHRQLVYFYEG